MTRIHDEIEQDFPLLNGTNYTVTSCADSRYICVSWAVGDIARKWESGARTKGYYWPPGVGHNDTPDEWAQIFVLHGYSLIEPSETHHEPGFEKIAILANENGAQHACRQLQDGKWTSKLGEGADIEHLRAELLECELFGQIVRVLKRQRLDWQQ
jgi:hypothetical protein